MSNHIYRFTLFLMAVLQLSVLGLMWVGVVSAEFAVGAFLLLLFYPMWAVAFPGLAAGPNWLFNQLERIEKKYHESHH